MQVKEGHQRMGQQRGPLLRMAPWVISEDASHLGSSGEWRQMCEEQVLL